jgi:hypothetical protein
MANFFKSASMQKLLSNDQWEEKLDWSMFGDPADPQEARVWVRGEHCDDDTERPLTKAELATAFHPEGDWELHFKLDDRAIKDKGFATLQKDVCTRKYTEDSVAESRIEICYATSKYAWNFNCAAEVTIKRVEVFDAEATVQDVLERIAASMCYGAYEGIQPSWRHPIGRDGRPVFELHYGT